VTFAIEPSGEKHFEFLMDQYLQRIGITSINSTMLERALRLGQLSISTISNCLTGNGFKPR